MASNVVLVAEDDAMIRMDVVSMIEAAGFAVVEATNAVDAIPVLERRSARTTDIDMPGRWTG